MAIKNLLEEQCHDVTQAFHYAEEHSEDYPFAWVLQLNKVTLGKFQPDNIESEKLIEARIFGEGHEIHIFQKEEGQWAAIETVNWKPLYRDEEQKLLAPFGKSLKIRHYIDFESEEGSPEQAYICGSCMNGWEGTEHA